MNAQATMAFGCVAAGSSSRYFQVKTTGQRFTSLKYFRIRCRSSVFESTRKPLSTVRAILEKKTSIKFSQEACLGVKTNSKRFGTVARYLRTSAETCAEWLSRTMRNFVLGG